MKLIDQPIKLKRKRYNKNKKKAWRKKIDLSDIERTLEDQRREERFGGPLEEKESCDLFVIDDGTEREATSDKEKSDYRKSNNKETLRCHYLLDGLPGVKAVLKKGPILPQKEPKQLRSARKSSGNTLSAVLKRTTVVEQRKSSLKKNKRNRSSALKFDRDLWAKDDKDLAAFDEVSKSFMKEPMQYYKEQVKKNKVKVSSQRFKIPSILPAVTVPMAGASYNPSLGDHQKLLSIALKSEKKVKKRESHEKWLKKRFLSTEVSPEDRLIEMSEGLPFSENDYMTPSLPDDENDTENEPKLEQFRPAKIEKKTNQSKRKKTIERIKEQNRKKKKERKMLENQIYRVKSIVKELDKSELRREIAEEKRDLKRKRQQKKTKRLAKTKFVDEEVVAPLGNEISGGLRSLQPRRGDLGIAMKNLQKRNIIETRNPKSKMTKQKVRKVVRRNAKQDMEKFKEKLNI